MFLISSDFGSDFLRLVKSKILDEDFLEVKKNFDSYADLNLPFSVISAPLLAEKFPSNKRIGFSNEFVFSMYRSGILENLTSNDLHAAFLQDPIASFHWSIYEAAHFYNLLDCQPWVKAYFSSLFIYCERLEPSLDVESDYLYLIVDEGEKELCGKFAKFIEWLIEFVPKDDEYDDYYLLLTWLLLKRISGDADEEIYKNVVGVLLAKKYTSSQISYLSVCERGQEEWLALHKRIPLKYGIENKVFETIILGLSE
nr:hypothetical protein [uncultured Albidiferax sp.]